MTFFGLDVKLESQKQTHAARSLVKNIRYSDKPPLLHDSARRLSKHLILRSLGCYKYDKRLRYVCIRMLRTLQTRTERSCARMRREVTGTPLISQSL